MENEVYTDSVSAWRRLIEIGGLELDDRDEDLEYQLKEHIDPNATDLNAALSAVSIDIFLQALFQVIQPFVSMYRDILDFFTKARTREGKVQWKLSIDNEIIDLRNFEEFLEQWTNIRCQIEVPAIDSKSSWILLEILQTSSSYDGILENVFADGSLHTGLVDVDSWLTEYEKGRYTQFPSNLRPNDRYHGLNDATSVVIGALQVLQAQRLVTRQSLKRYRNRCKGIVEQDAFHPCSIAQNETDYWLRTCVRILAFILKSSDEIRSALDQDLAQSYRGFHRRRMGAELQIRDLQRLLSLPVWKKRYEAYGVWVATEIVQALHDHKVVINHLNGELKFAFVESRIADVVSARPEVSLFSERRTPLNDPVGRGRVNAVQPDYGLWYRRSTPDECLMVVEVKHYKKRSRKNFRNVLVDYARAHPMAKVVLVNYGPVGIPFSDLTGVEDQCMMIGHLNPQNREARERFQNEVRSRIGEPIVEIPCDDILRSAQVFVIDVSHSMRTIIDGEWFSKFLHDLEASSSLVVLVDVEIRATLYAEMFADWRSQNDLDRYTALYGPVLEVLNQHGSVVVVTDQDGLNNLIRLDAKIGICKSGVDSDVMLLQISKPRGR